MSGAVASALEGGASHGQSEGAAIARPPGRLRRALKLAWSLLAGTVFCHSWIGGVLVVGWTYRLVQRRVLHAWWRRRLPPGGACDQTFATFLAESPRTCEQVRGPNWIVRQGGWRTMRQDLDEASGFLSSVWVVVRAPVHSLARNLRLGFLGLFNTWLLTFPGALLWAFGWYSGWNNSFHKGYEQAQVGVLIGLVGIVLFVTAMLYLPLAQVRQAVTGEWRSFFQFRLIWGLGRRRRLGCLVLGGLYSLASLPVMILVTVPGFLTVINPATLEMTDAELLELIGGYFFWVSLVGFLLFVMLRLAAARIYGGALLDALRDGEVPGGDLGAVERESLERLSLLATRVDPMPRPWVRAVRRTTRPILAVLGLVATALVWLTLVAQVFVAQFLNYHGARGWLNQPLVQVPWFRYVPAVLEESAKAAAPESEEERSGESPRATR